MSSGTQGQSIHILAFPQAQIGLNSDVWPLIQLFSFNDVSIAYNPGGRSQQVSLEYSEIPNISMNIDRKLYPSGSHVFLTVNDFQLNQDPTDRTLGHLALQALPPPHFIRRSPRQAYLPQRGVQDL